MRELLLDWTRFQGQLRYRWVSDRYLNFIICGIFQRGWERGRGALENVLENWLFGEWYWQIPYMHYFPRKIGRVWLGGGGGYIHILIVRLECRTVNPRYLDVERTLWNTSKYPHFDISDFQNWGKYISHNQISRKNMQLDSLNYKYTCILKILWSTIFCYLMLDFYV